MITKLLRRVRRNHALEHATISLLSRRHPQSRVLGVSGPLGFMLYTELSVEEVYPAALDALKLLRAGHHALAVHPNCGTNLVASASLTTFLTLLGARRLKGSFTEKVERILQLVLLNAIGLMLARPLGAWLQSHVTVDPHVEGVEIVSLRTEGQGDARRIYIHTRQN